MSKMKAYRHEERAFSLQRILHIGSRLFFHCEHGKRVHASKICGYRESAIEHDDYAHETCEQTSGKQNWQRGGNCADIVERNKQREAGNIGPLNAPGLQEAHHERREQAHTYAGKEACKLYVFASHA